jgi:hypothetical protein
MNRWQWWNDDDLQGKPTNSEKTLLQCHLFHYDHTSSHRELNRDLCSENVSPAELWHNRNVSVVVFQSISHHRNRFSNTYFDSIVLFYASLSHGFRNRGSSVSTVSDYRLDDRAIGVRSPAGAKDFSSNLYVQAGSEVHPASCTMGTGGLLPWSKRGRSVTLTTRPHLVPKSRMSRSYIFSTPSTTMACSGTALLLFMVSHCIHAHSFFNERITVPSY